MIHSPELLLVELSKIWEFIPGDLIFTGTPSGVSALQAGDELYAEMGSGKVTLEISVGIQ